MSSTGTWPWIRTQIELHFDKLMLFALLSLLMGTSIGITLYQTAHNNKLDPANVSWAKEQAAAVLGALIARCAGFATPKKPDDKS